MLPVYDLQRVRKEPLGPIVNSIVIVELVTRVIVSMVTVPVVFVLPDGKKITAAHVRSFRFI